MNRIVSTTERPQESVTPPGASALFDLEGRLLYASDEFLALLRERWLTEDLLVVPRSLALRTACGYSPGPTGPIAARRLCFRGSLYWLRVRVIGQTVVLTLDPEPSGRLEDQFVAPTSVGLPGSTAPRRRSRTPRPFRSRSLGRAARLTRIRG